MNSIVQNVTTQLFGDPVWAGSPPQATPERSKAPAPTSVTRLGPGDGRRALWNVPGGPGGPPSTLPDLSGARGGFFGLMNSLVDSLGAMIDALAAPPQTAGARQHVADATFSSTGDPHLSETGTLADEAGNLATVDRHFDSMTGHNDLVSSQNFDGGYRVSTSVTQPNDKGVTVNAAATVHLNGDFDTVTMRNDGTYAITDNGNDIRLDPSQSVTLESGAVVSRNADDSLTVVDRNANGGSATTTFAAKNGGVDATVTIHQATVTGDIVNEAVVAPRHTLV